MEKHVLSLFEIQNARNLSGAYRLLEVCDLPAGCGHDDRTQKNLNQIARKIAFVHHVPTALVRRDGKRYVAVPYGAKIPRMEIPLVPDVATVVPGDERHDLDFARLGPEERNVALSFLRFAFRTPFMGSNELWQSGASTLLTKRPVNQEDDSREVDVYGGFGYRVMCIDGRFYLAVRATYRYVDRRWLSDRCPDGRVEGYRMRHALYHFSDRW
jgi:hypothetical protein